MLPMTEGGTDDHWSSVPPSIKESSSHILVCETLSLAIKYWYTEFFNSFASL